MRRQITRDTQEKRRIPFGKGKKTCLTFLTAMCLLLPVCPASAEEKTEKNSTTSQLYAQSAVLMDADNGRILLSKNGEEILPMASTTKIMTCILVLEMEGGEEMAGVSAYAAGMPKVNMSSRKGEYYRVEDLLYSLMLESHNDAAAILAEHFGGKLLGMQGEPSERGREESMRAVLAFVDRMNEKAREIGCEKTSFVTPNGLDGVRRSQGGEERRHSSTAEDMAGILRYCISQSPQKEAFLTVTRTPSYQFGSWKKEEDGSFAEGGRSISCVNHNAFLQMMDGALTGKTGFTGQAGYCYVGALSRGEKTFTAALLACGWPGHKSWKWHDMRLLMEYALEAYEKETIDTRKEIAPIPVENGREETVRVAVEEKEVSLLLSEEDQTAVRWTVPECLQAPVGEGEVVGRGEIYINGELYDEIHIKTVDSVLEFTWMFCMQKVLAAFAL